MIKMWILRHFCFYLKSSNLFDIVLLHLFHLLLDQVLLVEELGSQGRHLTLEKKPSEIQKFCLNRSNKPQEDEMDDTPNQ